LLIVIAVSDSSGSLYNFTNRFVEGIGLTQFPEQFDMEGTRSDGDNVSDRSLDVREESIYGLLADPCLSPAALRFVSIEAWRCRRSLLFC